MTIFEARPAVLEEAAPGMKLGIGAELRKLAAAMRQEARKGIAQEPEPCERCGDTGTVTRYPESPPGAEPYEAPCPACD